MKLKPCTFSSFNANHKPLPQAIIAAWHNQWTVSVKMDCADGIRVSWESLQTLSCSHIPYPNTLIKLSMRRWNKTELVGVTTRQEVVLMFLTSGTWVWPKERKHIICIYIAYCRCIQYLQILIQWDLIEGWNCSRRHSYYDPSVFLGIFPMMSEKKKVTRLNTCWDIGCKRKKTKQHSLSSIPKSSRSYHRRHWPIIDYHWTRLHLIFQVCGQR